MAIAPPLRIRALLALITLAITPVGEPELSAQTEAPTRFPLLTPRFLPARNSGLSPPLETTPNWRWWLALNWDRVFDVKGRLASEGKRTQPDGSIQLWRPMSDAEKSQALVPVLVASLESNETRIRLAAAIALGKVSTSEAIAPLTKALSDRDRRVRNAAALALGLTQREPAEGPLIKRFESRKTDSIDRAWTALGLGFLGTQKSSAILLDFLNQPSSNADLNLCVAAAISLSKQASDRPRIRELAQNKRVSGAVAGMLHLALGRIGDTSDESKQVLDRGLQHQDPQVRAGSTQGLAFFANPLPVSIERLQRMATKDPVEDVRALARLALGSLGEASRLVPIFRTAYAEDRLGQMTEISGLALGLARRSLDAPLLATSLKSRLVSHKSAMSLAVGFTANDQLREEMTQRANREKSPDLFPSYGLSAAMLGGDISQRMRRLLTEDTQLTRLLTAALCLTIQGELDAVDGLFEELKQTQKSSRQQLLSQVAVFVGDRENVSVILEKLKDRRFPSNAKVLLITALGNIGDPRRYPAFSELAFRHPWNLRAVPLDEVLTLY